MVPGSTLRYGSNFWQVMVRPRLSSRHPMEAAAMPLPREETTPPVTKMNLATGHLVGRIGNLRPIGNRPRAVTGCRPGRLPIGRRLATCPTLYRGVAGADQLPDPLQVRRRIHTERL